MWDRILLKGGRTECCLFSQRPGKTKRNRSSVFLQSSLFFLYSLSCTKEEKQVNPISRRKEKVSVTFSFHLWPFCSFINGEGVLPKAAELAARASPGSIAPGANRARHLINYHISTYSSKGEESVPANSGHVKGAQHAVPCYLCSFSALNRGCGPLSCTREV